MKNMHDEELGLIDRVLKSEPCNTEALKHKAKSLFLGRRDAVGAKHCLDLAVAIDPSLLAGEVGLLKMITDHLVKKKPE